MSAAWLVTLAQVYSTTSSDLGRDLACFSLSQSSALCCMSHLPILPFAISLRLFILTNRRFLCQASKDTDTSSYSVQKYLFNIMLTLNVHKLLKWS